LVAGFSPQIKESLTNNIIVLKKENLFNHMGECIKMSHLGSELLDMVGGGGALLRTRSQTQNRLPLLLTEPYEDSENKMTCAARYQM
jgi:hypothetical protein